jgi:hypothetical protein
VTMQLSAFVLAFSALGFSSLSVALPVLEREVEDIDTSNTTVAEWDGSKAPPIRARNTGFCAESSFSSFWDQAGERRALVQHCSTMANFLRDGLSVVMSGRGPSGKEFVQSL